MRRNSLIVIGMAVLSTFGLTGSLAAGAMSARTTASAGGGGSTASTPVADDVDQEWFTELGTGLGIPPAEAQARYAWSDAFSEALRTLKKDRPDTYAWGEMHTTGEVGATVAFVGKPPADAERYFVGVPVKLTIVGGAPHSEATYVKAVSTAHYATRSTLKSLRMPTSEVLSEYDRVSGEVRVQLLGDKLAALPEAARNRLATQAQESLSALTLSGDEEQPTVRLVSVAGGVRGQR